MGSRSSPSLPQRCVSGLLPWIALLLPLLPALGRYQNISLWAYPIFLLAAGLAALCVLVLPPELAITGSGSLRTLWAPLCRLSPVRLLLLCYLLWSGLSAALSGQDGVWLGLGRREGLLTIFCYVFLFWAAASYGSWSDRLPDLLGLVLVCNAVLGLLQYAGLNPLWLFPEGTNFHDAFVLYNGAFLGTLGNIDILSAFLCLTVPLFYGLVCIGGHRRYLVPAAAGTLLLSVSRVDSGAVGLGLGVLLTLPLFFATPRGRRNALPALGTLVLAFGLGRLLWADRDTPLTLRPSLTALVLLVLGAVLLTAGLLLRRRPVPDGGHAGRCFLLLLGAVLATGLAGLLAVWLIPFPAGPMMELHQLLHGNFDPSFGSGRVQIWQETVKLIAQRPLLGGGPDTLVTRMPFAFSRFIEAVGRTVEVRIDTAHNDFLNIAVNQGIPAALFYAAALGVWLVRALRRLDSAPVLGALIPAVLAYVVQSCFTFSICSVSPLFWIVLGLGERMMDTSKIKQERRNST